MLVFSWLLKARKKRRAVTEEGESKNGVDPGVERLIRAFSHTESRLPIRSPTACSSAPLQEVRHQSTSELHEKSPLRGQSHSAHPLVLRFYFEHELPTDHSRIFFTECSFTYITWSLFYMRFRVRDRSDLGSLSQQRLEIAFNFSLLLHALVWEVWKNAQLI